MESLQCKAPVRTHRQERTLQPPASEGSSHDQPHFPPKQQRPQFLMKWDGGTMAFPGSTTVLQADAEGTPRAPRTLHRGSLRLNSDKLGMKQAAAAFTSCPASPVGPHSPLRPPGPAP